jgi:hypothetical protein
VTDVDASTSRTAPTDTPTTKLHRQTMHTSTATATLTSTPTATPMVVATLTPAPTNTPHRVQRVTTLYVDAARGGSTAVAVRVRPSVSSDIITMLYDGLSVYVFGQPVRGDYREE